MSGSASTRKEEKQKSFCSSFFQKAATLKIGAAKKCSEQGARAVGDSPVSGPLTPNKKGHPSETTRMSFCDSLKGAGPSAYRPAGACGCGAWFFFPAAPVVRSQLFEKSCRKNFFVLFTAGSAGTRPPHAWAAQRPASPPQAPDPDGSTAPGQCMRQKAPAPESRR